MLRLMMSVNDDTLAILQLISGIIFVCGFGPYIYAILTDPETRPSITSWLIWASLDTTTLVGTLQKHTTSGSLVGAIIGAWIVAVLAAFKGERKPLSKLEIGCLLGTLLGVISWYISGDATYGIVITAIFVFVGAFPTIGGAWKNPATENRLAWTLYFIAAAIAVAAIPKWTLDDSAQPISFFVIETIMVGILFTRPRTTTTN